MKQITDKNITIEDIPVFKLEAKEKIEAQKVRLISTAQDLVPFSSSTTSTITPLALITAPFRKGKAMTVVQGVILGYNLIRKLRQFFKK